MGPPTAPSWVTTAGIGAPSGPGPPSNALGLSESAIISATGSVAGGESRPALNGTFNPSDPLFGSQSGSLVTATIDELATLEKGPAQRRKLVIAAGIAGLVVLLLIIGTLVSSGDGEETKAEPTATPTSQAPAATGTAMAAPKTVAAAPSTTGDESSGDDDDDDDGDGDGDGDEPKSPPPKGGKKGGNKPPPPPKGGDDYDPFKSRK